ncbi:cytochrome P450 [Coprinopsis sp. MPI-PUGE-AT-0042]|nr:cytochrome P450 [Coprinopsis sp. MPI-PUGE-AT-0042]
MEDLGPALSPNLLFESVVFSICPEYIKINSNKHMKGERLQYAMSAVLGWSVQFLWRNMEAKTGYAMDDQDVVQRLGLDVSTYTLLGSCTNALEDSTEDLALPFDHPQYSAAASNPAKGASLFSMPSSPLPTPHMEVVNRFVDPIIQVALRKNAANPKGAESNEIEADKALLDHLVRSTSDHKLLRDETLNILLAGRDTVWPDSQPLASTVADHLLVLSCPHFRAYFLAMRPEVMKKLREEILSQVGPSKAPTYDDVRTMKYLRAVINEHASPTACKLSRGTTTRPNDVRTCANGGIWPSPDPNEKPIYIAPGTSTPYIPILIHTRKDLWGPDADEFDPDQFIDDHVKEYLVTNMIYLYQGLRQSSGTSRVDLPYAIVFVANSFQSTVRLTSGNGDRLLMSFTYFAPDRALELATGELGQQRFPPPRRGRRRAQFESTISATTRNNLVRTRSSPMATPNSGPQSIGNAVGGTRESYIWKFNPTTTEFPRILSISANTNLPGSTIVDSISMHASYPY